MLDLVNITEVVRAIESHETADAIVRIIIRLKSDQAPILRDSEIDAALSTAYSHNVSREVEHISRARLGGKAAETLSPAELVERYFVDKGYSSERVGWLVGEAIKIFEANHE